MDATGDDRSGAGRFADASAAGLTVVVAGGCSP
jgi:hypothetical protein